MSVEGNGGWIVCLRFRPILLPQFRLAHCDSRKTEIKKELGERTSEWREGGMTRDGSVERV